MPWRGNGRLSAWLARVAAALSLLQVQEISKTPIQTYNHTHRQFQIQPNNFRYEPNTKHEPNNNIT